MSANGSEDARFDEIMAAYRRGIEWGLKNGSTKPEERKAAYDYADKATSPTTTHRHNANEGRE